MLGQTNMDAADGVGLASAGEHGVRGPDGLGVQARPDSTPATGDGVGRRSGWVPDGNVRGAFGPVVAERGSEWDRMHLRSVVTPGVVAVSTVPMDDDLRGCSIRRHAVQPQPRCKADRAILEGWADLLAPMFATGGCCNLTGTYSDQYGYGHGLMLARNVIKDFRAFCRDQGRLSESACIGVERHPSGRDVLHFHAIIGGDWTEQEMHDAEALWISARGWAKAKPIVDRAGCIEYAAKHLLKQRAEDHFDFWTPPRTFGSRVERRAYAHGMTLDQWHDRNTDSER